MRKIKHPNIVHLYETLESSNNYYMIIDYCNHGDLVKYMKKRNITFFNEPEAKNIIMQIMNGFKILRKEKIIHRDIKLENILVHNDQIKIGDFGLAKFG